jgi:hypothetical protein
MQIVNETLTLKRRDNGDIRIIVDYDTRFNENERNLASDGLKWLETISIIGVDTFVFEGEVLDVFPPTIIFGITPGTGDQVLHRHFEKQVPRVKLDEVSHRLLHPDLLQDDIVCKIQVDPLLKFPGTVETFTNVSKLGLVATGDSEDLGA